MIRIIDNLLTPSYLKDLQQHFLSQNCEWYFNDNLTGDDSYYNIGSFGLVNKLHWNGYFSGTQTSFLIKALVFSALDEVKKVLKCEQEILRVRADMTLYNPLNHKHEIHTDFEEEHTTAIFYLNNSDGNTIIFDREGKKLLKEIEPVENRLVIFDGLLMHTGHSPSKHKSRALINMNFIDPELLKNNDIQNYR